MRKRSEDTEKILLANGAILAAPLVIFEVAPAAIYYGGSTLTAGGRIALTTGRCAWGRARFYYNTFGRYGGIENGIWNAYQQTTTQLTQNGSVSFGDYDFISFGTSALLRRNSGLGTQIIQGATPGIISWTPNSGFSGMLIEGPTQKNTATLLWSTTTPLGNSIGTFSPPFNNTLGGYIQGVINQMPNE